LNKGGHITLSSAEACEHFPVASRRGKSKRGVAYFDLGVLKVKFLLSPPNDHDDDKCASK
jgi:hypothetical protein